MSEGAALLEASELVPATAHVTGAERAAEGHAATAAPGAPAPLIPEQVIPVPMAAAEEQPRRPEASVWLLFPELLSE